MRLVGFDWLRLSGWVKLCFVMLVRKLLKLIGWIIGVVSGFMFGLYWDKFWNSRCLYCMFGWCVE